MKKVTVIGLFCEGKDVSDGQSIKTRIVTRELEKVFGTEAIRRIDTYGWKKNPFQLFFRSIVSVPSSKHVMFLTDEGGIKIFPWLLQVANLFGKTKIHYNVVGGWLPGSLKTRKLRTWWLKKLDGIYVETVTMKQALEKEGLRNVSIIRNCKPLDILSEDQLVYPKSEPLGLCTFSRVMKEKGIQDAVEAVCAVNSKAGKTVFTLDIFGHVDPLQEDWFAQLKSSFPEYVRYRGTVPYDASVETLKGYFALLFPTYFHGEGLAGTLIDAFSAGVPVVASKWKYNEEFVFEGINGTIVPPRDAPALAERLLDIYNDMDAWNAQKVKCLIQAKQYTPEVALEDLISALNSEG